jgi:hypothetical protein
MTLFIPPMLNFQKKNPFRFEETMTHKNLHKPWFLETMILCNSEIMVFRNRSNQKCKQKQQLLTYRTTRVSLPNGFYKPRFLAISVRKNHGDCCQKYTVLRVKLGFKGGIKETRGRKRNLHK